MEETIIAQMVPGGDTESINYEFSVKSYADYILGNNFPVATKALVQAMLNYGNYAKAYFSKTDLAATDAMAGITAETLSGYAPTRSGEGESSYYGSSLLLESNVVIRHYFTEEVQGATQAENGYWHIDITNIPAHELDAAKATTVNGVTIRYSPLSYAYIVLNGGSDDVRLQNLVKAMYLYNQAADSYRSGQ